MIKNAYFIVGPHGVGKTYAINELRKVIDLVHVDTGPIIRGIHRLSNSGLPLGKWIEKGEQAFGKDFSNYILCEEISKIIKDNHDEEIFITGNRTVAGINYIIDYFKIENPVIIYLDSPFYNLKENYDAREGDNNTAYNFDEIIRKELSSGLGALKEYVKEHPEFAMYIYREHNEDISPCDIYKASKQLKSSAQKQKVKEKK